MLNISARANWTALVVTSAVNRLSAGQMLILQPFYADCCHHESHVVKSWPVSMAVEAKPGMIQTPS